MEKIIQITSEDNNMIQLAFLTYTSSIEIFNDITANNENLNSQILSFLNEQILQNKLTLEQTKTNIINKYVPSDLTDYDYYFNFNNQTIVLKVK